MRTAELKAIEREHGLRGYSRLRKAELIALLRDNLQPLPPPAPRTRPEGSHVRRPPRLTGGLWPLAPRRASPPSLPSVRFRPDRPRQPELMRQLEERNLQPPKPSTPLALPVVGCLRPRTNVPALKLYQLKPKRGKETFMESSMEQKELPTLLAGCSEYHGPRASVPPDPKKLK